MLSGCGGSPGHAPLRQPPAGWTSFHDRGHGLTVRFPSSWRRAREPLTPSLVDPVEILSIGTFAPRSGAAGSCANFPVGALRAAGARDVFLTVQERRGGGATFAPRPRPFDLGTGDKMGPLGTSVAARCVGRRVAWRSYWVPFSDAGRSFYLLTAIGRDAAPARVRALHEVLDSLRFETGKALAPLPAPATGQRPFALGQGVNGTLPTGWHLIRRRLTAAITSRAQVAAATFRVPPGPPNRNCTPTAALHRLPPDGAFVYLFEYPDFANHPRPLARFPVRPAHFALRRSALGDFECMGHSYLLVFRDHRRAFQAHIYLGRKAGLSRRREVLQFLEHLQIDPARGTGGR